MTVLYETDYSSEMIGKIIMVTRQLEKQLRELTGSDAAGLHAQTETASNMLSRETQRQLHYIGAVRNQAAHEDDFTMSTEEFNNFLHIADAVSAAIKTARQNIDAAADSTQQQTPQSRQQPMPENNYPAENYYAVEKELFAQIAKTVMKLGFFPLVGIIQLLYLLLCSMKKQVWVIFLSILYSCSVILAYKGWTSELHHALLYLGAGCFVFSHVCVFCMAIKRPVFPALPRYLWMIPVLNIFYLLCRWFYELYWPQFLIAAAGLGCFAGAIILCIQEMYEWGLAALVASWVFSAIGSYFWGKKA